ncbi:MAG: hypothetical protein ACPK85_07615 [Methanosarcina sp.]
MAETFFGPWRIVVTFVNSHFLQSFTIFGSENADGRYNVSFGNPLELTVQGEKWEIQIEWFPFAPDASFQPSAVRRTTKFIAGEGLIVKLDADAQSPGSLNHDYDNLTLICTSMNPEINPIPTNNPYDFTIPEH